MEQLKKIYKNKHIATNYYLHPEQRILSNYTTTVNVDNINIIRKHIVNIILPNSILLIIFEEQRQILIENYCFCIQPSNKLKICDNNFKFNKLCCTYKYPYTKCKKISNIITNIIFQHSIIFEQCMFQTKNIFLIENISNNNIFYLNDNYLSMNYLKIIIFKNIKIIMLFIRSPRVYNKLLLLRNTRILHIKGNYSYDNLYDFNFNKLCNTYKLWITYCKDFIFTKTNMNTNNIIKNYILNIDNCYDHCSWYYANKYNFDCLYFYYIVKYVVKLNLHKFNAYKFTDSMNTVRILQTTSTKYNENTLLYKYIDFILLTVKNIFCKN